MSGIPGPEVIGRGLAPDAAIAFWKQRAKLTWPEVLALDEGARHRAFYVSELAQRDLVQLVSDGLQSALENGETLPQFKERIQEAIRLNGWHDHRIENIYRTNMQTAYSAGRYAKMQAVKESRPYWQYVTVEDKRRRLTHAAMHGMVYPADHEFWSANYPPNGFRCRCSVRTLSARQVKQEGLTVQRKMPGDTMWTDPKTGMEYHVARPGADDGFRNNPGKDWLAGLDLNKYPDVTPKSYEERRGPASKRPAPVKTYAELAEGIKARCAEFATNNGIHTVDVKNDPSCFMCTWCEGTFRISSHTFKLRDGRIFNAAEELKSAWNKISAGKALTWEEEYACESLWHEITHNTQTRGRMPRKSAKECMMEVVTQWTARRSYHEMIEALGGKSLHQDDIIKNGLGYGIYLKRFDRLLSLLKIKDDELLMRLQYLISSLSTPEYFEEVENMLAELSGKNKSAIKRALSNINKNIDYEELLQKYGLS